MSDIEDPQIEPESTPNPEVKISKRTGLPVRKTSDAQRAVLNRAREEWNKKRKEQAVQKNLVKQERKVKRETEIKEVNNEIEKLKLSVKKELEEQHKRELDMLKNEYEDKLKDLPKMKQKKPKKVKTIEYFADTDETDTDTEKVKPKKNVPPPQPPSPPSVLPKPPQFSLNDFVNVNSIRRRRF